MEGIHFSEQPEPPIKPPDVFSPEKELKEIRQGSHEEKRAKLEEFKDKLAYQKEGIAETQEALMWLIRKNPGISYDEFHDAAFDYARRYGLDQSGHFSIDEIFSEYERRHHRIEEMRRIFPSDFALYTAIFNQPPKGKIEVIKGPMTLYFKCHDPRDYALVRSGAFLESRAPTPHEIDASNMSSGVNIGKSLVKGLEGTLAAENSRFVREEDSEKTFIHEEQHAIKRLFKEKLFDRNAFEFLLEGRMGEVDEKKLRLFTERWLREYRKVAEGRAKDEILAYFKEGERTPEETFNSLVLPEENGGVYDYLASAKKSTMDSFLEVFSGEHLMMFIEAAEKVFDDEYQGIIIRGADSITTLRNAGYSKEKIIALLMLEPLSKWRKVTDRLLEDKSKKGEIEYDHDNEINDPKLRRLDALEWKRWTSSERF